MDGFLVVLFIILSMIIGILVVNLTSPKPSMFEFKIDLKLRVDERWFNRIF
jgi:hypothetical protein